MVEPTKKKAAQETDTLLLNTILNKIDQSSHQIEELKNSWNKKDESETVTPKLSTNRSSLTIVVIDVTKKENFLFAKISQVMEVNVLFVDRKIISGINVRL